MDVSEHRHAQLVIEPKSGARERGHSWRQMSESLGLGLVRAENGRRNIQTEGMGPEPAPRGLQSGQKQRAERSQGRELARKEESKATGGCRAGEKAARGWRVSGIGVTGTAGCCQKLG